MKNFPDKFNRLVATAVVIVIVFTTLLATVLDLFADPNKFGDDLATKHFN